MNGLVLFLESGIIKVILFIVKYLPGPQFCTKKM